MTVLFMQKSGNRVAALFEHTSPYAETSPDAGSNKSGPLPLQHHCCARYFSSDGKTTQRAPWPRCCVLHELCEREPADGADVFRHGDGIPIASMRQARNTKSDRIEMYAHTSRSAHYGCGVSRGTVAM